MKFLDLRGLLVSSLELVKYFYTYLIYIFMSCLRSAFIVADFGASLGPRDTEPRDLRLRIGHLIVGFP